MLPNRAMAMLILLAISMVLPAQKIDVEKLKGLSTRNIGPASMSGRVTAIDVDLSDPNIIYIGAAAGGVWKSISGGLEWTPIFDGQPVQSIGALAVNQQNPNEIWAGTGEGNPRNSQNSGAGVYRSQDGGQTWTYMGLKETKAIHRILIHPKNSKIIYVAALGSAWGPNEERGVFRTKDGGQNWERILFVNADTGCASMVMDPQNPDKLIAAMWEYRRQPWTFTSGGKGSGIYISYNGGDDWSKCTVEQGLPRGELGRIGLAIAPSNPDKVYAIIEAEENAFYKSDDGGKNWQKTTSRGIGNRPFYYSDIYVDPLNENRIYNLWGIITKSEDGGKTFETFVRSKVHPDHHAFWVHPSNPQYMIDGNDGGVSISRDGGKHWRFVANLPLSQFYHINYDNSFPYRVGGGTQDNGAWVGPSAISGGGGLHNGAWNFVQFGDNFDFGFRPDDPRYIYILHQGGSLFYTNMEINDSYDAQPVHPEGKDLRFNWNAGFAQNPFHDCGIYLGSQFLHKSMDCGRNWTIISPDLTTNDPEKQRQRESGGLTIDDTQAENFTTIVSIAPSPVAEQVIWVGTDDGNLQLTQDGGQSWTNLAHKLPSARPGSWIPHIEVSSYSAGEAFIVVNDYRRNDWRPMVFHTENFGKSFKRIVDEHQVDGHVWAIVQDPVEPQLLWLGSDFGLYFSIDKGGNWNKWTNNFPSTCVRDLKIHPREHDLIIGTFGRSIWILDDIRPFRILARTKGQVLEEDFFVFGASDAYLYKYQPNNGIRFPGNAFFKGDNKTFRVVISIWLKPENQLAPQEKKAIIKVIDASGDTIRSFKSDLSDGINQIVWSLNKDAVYYPSRRRRTIDPNDLPPGIRDVAPGIYTLMISCGDWQNVQQVRVHADPKGSRPIGDIEAEHSYHKKFYHIVDKARQGMDQLLLAKETIEQIEQVSPLLSETDQIEVNDLRLDLLKQIEALELLFMGPVGQKGLQLVNSNLKTTFYDTVVDLNVRDGELTQCGKIMLKRSETETKAILEKVNAFLLNDFKEFQKKIEKLKFPLIKMIRPIELE